MSVYFVVRVIYYIEGGDTIGLIQAWIFGSALQQLQQDTRWDLGDLNSYLNLAIVLDTFSGVFFLQLSFFTCRLREWNQIHFFCVVEGSCG